MNDTFSIMCFSWNASGLRLCETMSQSKADNSRKGFIGFIKRKSQCLAPDFFEEIRTIINNKHPSLIVMTTQDEDISDTYFHSQFLPNTMPEIGYSFVKRDKLSGIGEAASGVSQFRVPTGKPLGSALRISIYAKNQIIKEIKLEEELLEKFFSNNGQSETICKNGNRISGAIASYIWHSTYGKFVFIATHLPSGINSLNIGTNLDYESYRAASRAANSLCLLSIYNKFVSSLSEESRPDHIFLLGDLNYNITISGKSHNQIISEISSDLSAKKLKDLQQYDELKKAMEDVPLLGFKEGVSDEGPLFMPTWRLARGRPASCSSPKEDKINVTCFGESTETYGGLGWHDRILYKELMEKSKYISHCIDYIRLDVNNMNASTHAGVIAFFEMKPIY